RPTNRTDPMPNAIATTTVASAVVRRRTDPPDSRPGRRPGSAPVMSQPVTRAAHRLNAVAVEGTVDLVAEMTDVDLDDVRVTVEVEVPHVLQNLPLRDDIALVAQQVLEYRQLS